MTEISGVEHLQEQIRRNRAIAEEIGDRHRALDRVQRWQRARLRATYADLRAQPRFEAACGFFLVELYGGKDVHERDRQLARVAPVMRQSLPDPLLYAVGEALRLQAISLELDRDLAGHLDDRGTIDQPAYAAAYRRMAAWDRREEQIRLIGELGRLLDATIKKPFVRGLIRMMRIPSTAAGFGVLQGFLERGLDAFAAMGDAHQFLDTIQSRERRALEAIREGSDWPFEPWIGRGPVT